MAFKGAEDLVEGLRARHILVLIGVVKWIGAVRLV
jgi:hypothetical protein